MVVVQDRGMGIFNDVRLRGGLLEGFMSRSYRTDLIPRWVWVMLPVSLVLVAVVGLSMPPKAGENANWDNVQTANPKDYVESPAPKVTITPSPAPPQPQSPSQPKTPAEGAPSPGTSSEIPKSLDFDRTKYVQTPDSPVELDVITTGEYAGANIIYKKPSAQPPYKELFVETAPNSGKFYRYVPQKQTGSSKG